MLSDCSYCIDSYSYYLNSFIFAHIVDFLMIFNIFWMVLVLCLDFLMIFFIYYCFYLVFNSMIDLIMNMSEKIFKHFIHLMMDNYLYI